MKLTGFLPALLLVDAESSCCYKHCAKQCSISFNLPFSCFEIVVVQSVRVGGERRRESERVLVCCVEEQGDIWKRNLWEEHKYLMSIYLVTWCMLMYIRNLLFQLTDEFFSKFLLKVTMDVISLKKMVINFSSLR